MGNINNKISKSVLQLNIYYKLQLIARVLSYTYVPSPPIGQVVKLTT